MTDRSVGQTKATSIADVPAAAPERQEPFVLRPLPVHRATALLVLAACSGGSSTSSSQSAVADHRGETPGARPHQPHSHAGLPPLGGVDTRAPVPACPRESDLVPRLRELWQVPPDASIDIAACTRGRFPAPGWLVDAFIDTSDEDSEERVEILAADGSGIVAALDSGSAPPADRFDTGAGDGWEAADLDADGIDELLQLQERNQVAVRSTTLAVFRAERAALREVGSLRLAFDNRGQKAISTSRIVQCSSQYALSDGPDGTRHILIEGTITQIGRQSRATAGAWCPLPGTHRYRLAGGSLEEVRP